MEDNKTLRIVYTFFVGLLLAGFVGFGIDTFYTAPPEPKYPTELSIGKELTAEQSKKQAEFNKQVEEYSDKTKPYNRTVSIVALFFAVGFVGISLGFGPRIKIIADGVLLGGLFTLLYSIFRGIASEDSKYVFVLAAAGLLVVLYLGYHRFIQKRSKKPAKKKPAKKRAARKRS